MSVKERAASVFIVLLLLAGCAAQEAEPALTPQEETSVSPEPYVYSFDPHVISRVYIDAYGPDIEGLFYGFCDAVLEGRNTFPCPDEETFHRLLAIARTCLPVASFCIDEDAARTENGIGCITYTMDDDLLRKTVTDFQDKVTSFIKEAVPYQEDDFITAIELLTALAHKDTADEDSLGLDSILEIMPYRAIMENKGICQELSGEYIYYLLQTGIDALTCSGLSADRETAHMWVLVELDGRYYHADPMFTIEYKDSLAFFGLNDAMREQYGDLPAADYSYGEIEVKDDGPYKVTDERFKRLWRAESYTIDRTARKLDLKLFDVYAPEESDEFYY